MVIKTFSGALCAATIFLAQAANAALSHEQRNELLAAHHKYRAELRLPPLAWSDGLAASAQAWAEHLAHRVRAMVHSGRPSTGENIATWSGGNASLTHLVNLWGEERKHFIDAPFPNVSRTGDWKAVAHYTQIVWRNTREVGCGLASAGGQDHLVCQYYPQGNIMRQRAF